jgi:uncharacterized SAM-binding protein YcdF (DUF218 family)
MGLVVFMINNRNIIVFPLLISLIFIASSCYYSGKATKKLLKKAEASEPYEIIIVPGVPLYDGKWNRTMKGRVYWSKYLYDKGIAKNIMYSGASVYSPYYEAEVMKLYAIAIGIPADHIYTEKKAEHSTENAYYSYKYARKLGFNRIALASDPFQTRTLRGFVRKRLSSDIGFIPFVVDTLKVIDPTMIDPAIDYAKAYNKNFVSIKERDSFWKRIHGTLWGNMDTAAYR